MSDIEDDDFSRFVEEDDDIKPIDIGRKPQPQSPATEDDIPKPVFEDTPKPATDDIVLSDDLMSDIEHDIKKTEEEILTDANPPLEKAAAAPEPEQSNIPAPDMLDEGEINYIKKGEYIDLREKRPELNNIILGTGWDQRAFEEAPLDLDISLFLLNKEDMTRVDEDFVFYNNTEVCEGAIKHSYDSRSGAGDGDDESIKIDLNGIPFDILKIVVVISIYDPEFTGEHFGKVKNIYIRVVDISDGYELFRYKLDDEMMQKGNALIVGTLIREGPKWIFEATSTDPVNAGLAKYATDYGIIIKELQSTGGGED